MAGEFFVLLVMTIVLCLRISCFKCDDQAVKNIKPIISELFDMLLENIEAKRKEETHFNKTFLKNEKDLNHYTEDNKSTKLTTTANTINEADQDKVKILDREISILDGQMNLRLGIVVSLLYGNQSVMVLKQWNESYSKISKNYSLLCSSSNINSNFITNPSEYREIHNANKNYLLFEMKQEISNLNEKTFLLCLSDSITSNHSIYITKLSFSSSHELEETNHHNEKSLNQFEELESKSDLVGNHEILELNQQENDDQILVRTKVPNGQNCSDFKLILLSNQKTPIMNGELLPETKTTNNYENICFWSLKLENIQFNDSNLLEIVQRHKNSGATFAVAKVKLTPINYKYGKRNQFMLSKSFLFKIFLLILNLIPIILLTLGVYLVLAEIWTIISSKILENNKCLSNAVLKSSKCQQRTNVSYKTLSNRDNDRNINCVDKRKEAKSTQFSKFNIVTRKNLNSEESGLSSGENEPVVKGDPYRYFDSDCSISTHTGI
ncbi:Uncharacterized protein cmbei_5004280 [Cryptosporidium meleagridis]